MAKPALKWSHSPGSRHFQSDGFGEVPRRIEGQQGGGNGLLEGALTATE